VIPDWVIRAGLYALLAAALVGAGIVQGLRIAAHDRSAEIAEQLSESRKVIARQSAVTEKVITQYRDRVQIQQGVATTIEKEVTRYVESKPLALACLLDSGWVRLHDAAAAGVVPKAASDPDAAGAGIASTEALRTVTGNYSSYHQVADRLSALQAWVRGQYEATNGEALGY
jgi:hypothetical protein